jgi:hypothetical protein
MLRRIFVPFLLLLALAARLQAAVDLVTLPTRDATQLTIYNSEDITMVREHRLLTVKEDVNVIQFSWANTLIDPTSIEFRILDQQDKEHQALLLRQISRHAGAVEGGDGQQSQCVRGSEEPGGKRHARERMGVVSGLV